SQFRGFAVQGTRFFMKGIKLPIEFENIGSGVIAIGNAKLTLDPEQSPAVNFHRATQFIRKQMRLRHHLSLFDRLFASEAFAAEEIGATGPQVGARLAGLTALAISTAHQVEKIFTLRAYGVTQQVAVSGLFKAGLLTKSILLL